MNFEQWFTREYPGEDEKSRKIAAAAWEEATRQSYVGRPTKELVEMLLVLKIGQRWKVAVRGGTHESIVFIMDFNGDTVWIHENNHSSRRDWRTRRIDDLDFINLL